ncbi:stage II sporulation protein M [Catalinimonas alkaloidigena]|nr:stage II sporulation protein M [Catalinimonas alkaloidigena]
MREAAFIQTHVEKWRKFETLVNGQQSADPDLLANLFVEVSDDLAFAQTHFPNSKNTAYLNELAARVHQQIYRNRRERSNRLVQFWKTELPLLMAEARRPLLYSFLIFFLACVIGALSAANDATFARLILGDAYINMTLDNIEQGDPMGVYKQAGQTDMFFGITFNNIRVSFYAFAMGLLLSFGTGYMLFQNGVMLGAFQYFFYQKGLLLTSFLTIWIHGTLEISAIVIAGAAGLVMGNSILFPGTYPRGVSFRKGARKGVKIVVGLVPIFIVAGFLESFVTRLTDMPWPVKVAIIGGSASFILWYFVVYPYQLQKKHE